MDLNEFIHETLVQVTKGVAAAQEATRNNGHAEINPLLRRIKTPIEGSRYPSYEMDAENLKGSGLLLTDEMNYVASMVEFDIAVTVESNKKTSVEGEGKMEGNAKIYIADASVNLQGKAVVASS